MIPELKELTKEQLQAGDGIDLLASKFQGLASSQVNTFEGAIARLKNAFGDLQESVGNFVTQSPEIAAIINFARTGIESFTKQVDQAAKSGGLRSFLIAIVDIGRAVNTFLIRPLTIFFQIAKIGFDTVVAATAGLIAAWGKAAGLLGKIISRLPGFKEFGQELQTISETTADVAGEKFDMLGDSVNNLFKPNEFANNADEFLNKFQETIVNAEKITTDFKNNTDGEVTKTAEKAVTIGELFAQIPGEIATGVDEGFKKIEKISTAAQRVAQTITKGFGSALGSGFAAFGAALAKGENALDAFVKSFLGSLGQMMIQQGTAFILQGLGFSVIPGLQASGGTLLATGAALAALGGALTAVGGGGGAGSAASVAGGGAGGGTEVNAGFAASEEDLEREEPDTQVAINIQGDVLDSDDTGLRIVEVLNNAFDKQGVQVRGGLVGA